MACERLIIDRHAGPALETRALGVQARTMEIYAKLGLAERALELGKRGTGANIWADGRRPRASRSARPDGAHSVSVHPDPRPGRQRAHPRREARALGSRDVQWNTELVGLDQQPDHVRAHAQGSPMARRAT